MVWDISLVTLCQLSRLCALPYPPNLLPTPGRLAVGAEWEEDSLDAMQTLLSNRQNVSELARLF